MFITKMELPLASAGQRCPTFFGAGRRWPALATLANVFSARWPPTAGNAGHVRERCQCSPTLLEWPVALGAHDHVVTVQFQDELVRWQTAEIVVHCLDHNHMVFLRPFVVFEELHMEACLLRGCQKVCAPLAVTERDDSDSGWS